MPTDACSLCAADDFVCLQSHVPLQVRVALQPVKVDLCLQAGALAAHGAMSLRALNFFSRCHTLKRNFYVACPTQIRRHAFAWLFGPACFGGLRTEAGYARGYSGPDDHTVHLSFRHIGRCHATGLGTSRQVGLALAGLES